MGIFVRRQCVCAQPSCKKKGKVHPCTGTEALCSPYGPYGSRGIAVHFLDHVTTRGEGSTSRPGRFYPREGPGTHFTGTWVGPRVGLKRCGKSPPTEIRSPDRPVHSQSLYRLRYPAHSRHVLGRKFQPA